MLTSVLDWCGNEFNTAEAWTTLATLKPEVHKRPRVALLLVVVVYNSEDKFDKYWLLFMLPELQKTIRIEINQNQPNGEIMETYNYDLVGFYV